MDKIVPLETRPVANDEYRIIEGEKCKLDDVGDEQFNNKNGLLPGSDVRLSRIQHVRLKYRAANQRYELI